MLKIRLNKKFKNILNWMKIKYSLSKFVESSENNA